MKKSSLFKHFYLTNYLLNVLTGALLLPLPDEEDDELDGVLGLKLLVGAS
jgi:hypothetical protein